MRENEKLLRAMSEIDEDLIYEASITDRSTPTFIKKLTAIAAVFVLVIGSVLIIRSNLLGKFLPVGGNDMSAAPPSYDKNEGASEEAGNSDGNEESEKDDEEENEKDEEQNNTD